MVKWETYGKLLISCFYEKIRRNNLLKLVMIPANASGGYM